MQGILIVDKPTDWTSFDVIAKLRGILGTRKLGHSGTLDPMATGVLPVFCGGASKAVDLQLDHTKAYRATLKLGARTDTGDVTGTVLETAPVTAGEKELLEVLPRFVGPRMQTPPMYSAVKINGQPLSIQYEGSPAENEYTLTVQCSKGTYIRVLLEEIAEAMGQKGTMSALRRVAAAFTASMMDRRPAFILRLVISSHATRSAVWKSVCGSKTLFWWKNSAGSYSCSLMIMSTPGRCGPMEVTRK